MRNLEIAEIKIIIGGTQNTRDLPPPDESGPNPSLPWTVGGGPVGDTGNQQRQG